MTRTRMIREGVLREFNRALMMINTLGTALYEELDRCSAISSCATDFDSIAARSINTRFLA